MPLQVGSIDVLQRPVGHPETSDPCYDGSQSSTTILPKHYRKGPNAAPFQAATFLKRMSKSVCEMGQIFALIFFARTGLLNLFLH
jgi:hypothetical protein